MKVLILTEEVWNDQLYPNNVMTNWFENFNGQLANIYLASGMPDNPCCSNYFQITDKMALKSILRKKGVGKWFVYKNFNPVTPHRELLHQNFSAGKETYRRFIKVVKPLLGGSLRLLRDELWRNSKWENSLLMDFLADFRPDVIFSLRFSSRRILYMECLLHSVTGAPVVPFTGDDEYSLVQFNTSPAYWLRRLLLRKDLRKNARFYGKFYSLSERQSAELREKLGTATGVILKGGDFSESYAAKNISSPIRIIYAGRLYCNRDKTLMSIAKAINAINKEKILITLEIYTGDKLNGRAKTELNDGKSVFYKGFVSVDSLKKIYKEADIALHVESFDLKNRLLTRYSFSTKVVDCLASTCAVLAIGPLDNEGIHYLKSNRSAICIGKSEEIYPILSHIAAHSDKIELYRKKAWELGRRAHQKPVIRQRLYQELLSVLENNDK